MCFPFFGGVPISTAAFLSRYCNTDLVDGSWSGVSAFDAANEFAFTNDEQTSVPSTYFQRPNEDEETDVSLARRLSVRASELNPAIPLHEYEK